jgi:7,8-didemethyl-8-hydroxy-5-deazariboflavin synthase CofH subunit
MRDIDPTSFVTPPAGKHAERNKTSVRNIIEDALGGADITSGETEVLFEAQGDDIGYVLQAADVIRRRLVGDDVTYVINRNINFTNVCYMGCRFCAFAKRLEDLGAEFLDLNEIIRRAEEAHARGATEVCIQGGLHPDMEGGHYLKIVKAIKAALPNMHIHAFSPFEIWYGARKTRRSYRDFLRELKDIGLGSMPGTAAEILDTEIRKILTRNKLSAEQWVEIITTAHNVGIPTTSTIMYGHVDGPVQWATHLDTIRSIQKNTGGFTEFVPLAFVHEDSPLYSEEDGVRPGPTRRESLLMHAVARIFFQNYIKNIQVSWVKLGPAFACDVLECGANDLGGTLMNESISRAAGGMNGQEITSRELCLLIQSIGRTAVQRTTLYKKSERQIGANDDVPLVNRCGRDPLGFLHTESTFREGRGSDNRL